MKMADKFYDIDPKQPRTIRVSGKVFQHIIKHGKFSETASDVLERLLKLNY